MCPVAANDDQIPSASPCRSSGCRPHDGDRRELCQFRGPDRLRRGLRGRIGGTLSRGRCTRPPLRGLCPSVGGSIPAGAARQAHARETRHKEPGQRLPKLSSHSNCPCPGAFTPRDRRRDKALHQRRSNPGIWRKEVRRSRRGAPRPGPHHDPHLEGVVGTRPCLRLGLRMRRGGSRGRGRGDPCASGLAPARCCALKRRRATQPRHASVTRSPHLTC